MITIEQCRAARGLLDWTQQDLAEACGLSKTAINNFEKGHSDIKVESLRAIRQAFESAEIEFLPDNGLRKRRESVQVLKGAAALTDLLDDMYVTLKDIGGEILIANLEEQTTRQASSKRIFEHLERLKKDSISERIICPEGTAPILSGTGSYRWLPVDNVKSAMATFIYADKVAFELWDRNLVVIITSPDAAKAERLRFEYLWETASAAITNSEKKATR